MSDLETVRRMQNHIEELTEALRELYRSVEATADIGKRRQLTVSPRVEDALAQARKVLRVREGEQV